MTSAGGVLCLAHVSPTTEIRAKAMAHKRRFNNVDATGRRKFEPFIMFKKYMLNHPSWLDMSPEARCLFIELRRRFNGVNNGDISLSCREAAKVAKTSKGTANKALRELIEHGFIKMANKGYFSNRHATTWILTNEGYAGASPTNEWARWGVQMQKAVPLAGRKVPQIEPSVN